MKKYRMQDIIEGLPDVPVRRSNGVRGRWWLRGRWLPTVRGRRAYARLVNPNRFTEEVEVAWSVVERVLNTPGSAVHI